MIRNDVLEAAENLGDVIDIIFDPDKNIWEKMVPGVKEAIEAIQECGDIVKLEGRDRSLAIIDCLEELLHDKKKMFITYSDEEVVPVVE